MNDILKQRLVGALILVALGVVFWPIIFVEPGADVTREELDIPERPQIETSAIPAPTAKDTRPPEPFVAREEMAAEQQQLDAADTAAAQPEPEPAVEEPAVEPAPPVTLPEPEPEQTAAVEEPAPIEEAEPALNKTRDEAPVKPELDAQGVPIAWILRVASVSSEAKAESLRQRLITMDQKAYVQRVPREGGDLYRVYIGPKFEKALLEKEQPKIDAAFGVSTMITRYVP